MRKKFKTNNNDEVVREIQKYLLGISYAEGTTYLPHIAIDGIYGNETRDAVKKFQRRYGLEESGNADYDTWRLLHRKFLESQKKDK